jgi:small-conductance mechanosensitive channel
MNQAAELVDPKVSNVWETVNSLINGFLTLLPNLVIALGMLFVFWLLAKGLRRLIQYLTRENASANIGMVIGRVAYGGMLLLGLLVAVTIAAPSVKPADLLSMLGVGGVAIGFAFRDILQNFLAGLLILLRQPFEIGDQIVFGDYEGTVDQIETRATLIKTYDGRRVVIPNGEIYTESVIVNTAHKARRSQYDIGIGYGDDICEAAQIILAAMQSVEGVLEEPAPDVLTVDLAGSSVNLRARWWTQPARARVVQVGHAVLTTIKEHLDAAQIDMPYPTRVVLFHDQTEETDGDRTTQREGWPAGKQAPKSRTIAQALAQSSSGVQPNDGTERHATASKS